jgi:hypothetical protein
MDQGAREIGRPLNPIQSADKADPNHDDHRLHRRLEPPGARFQEHALGYRYPISWALANASVRFLAPSLRMADDR